MRVRYEMYRNGVGTGWVAECDLTERQARKRFNELKRDGVCGWVELVGEDDDDYMEILDSHCRIREAQMLSRMGFTPIR